MQQLLFETEKYPSLFTSMSVVSAKRARIYFFENCGKVYIVPIHVGVVSDSLGTNVHRLALCV